MGLDSGLLLVGFLVITVMTVGLVTHQIYKLKKFDLMMRERDDARFEAPQSN